MVIYTRKSPKTHKSPKASEYYMFTNNFLYHFCLQISGFNELQSHVTNDWKKVEASK